MIFDQDRKFGVEFEFIADEDIETIGNDFYKETDLPMYTYLDAVPSRQAGRESASWVFKTDGSLNSGGYEICSPALKGLRGLNELKLGCGLIGRHATVDSSCGLHVHHDVKGITTNQLANLYRIWRRLWSNRDFRSIVPRQRRSAPYCMALPAFQSNTIADSDQLALTLYFINERYYSVNFQAIRHHGTVEFRLHEGTLDSNAVSNWVVFTQSLISAAARKTLPDSSYQTVLELLNDFVGLKGKDQPKLIREAKIAMLRKIKQRKRNL